MKTRKSWREKLDRHTEPRIVQTPAGSLLIPIGKDIERVMRTVPKGRLITQREIRESLAREAGADRCCPIVTGILVRIAAEVAVEEEQAGKKRVTPFWRVVRDNGQLIDKLPGGVEAQAERLREEGHDIVRGRVMAQAHA